MAERHLSQEAHLWYTISSPDYIAKAKVKLQGFDYNIFGGLEGRVEYISPDALGESDNKPGGNGRYYRALVRSERSTLRYKGEAVQVIPGMSATVEIKTGERSVLSFLLRPM